MISNSWIMLSLADKIADAPPGAVVLTSSANWALIHITAA
jgi:hypothetical protein